VPGLEPERVDAVFAALADPTRRAVLSSLSARPELTASRLAGELPITRQAVTKHLAALDAFGRLDVIVPNAGVQHVSPVREFPEEKWDLLISLMLTSPFLLSRYAWDALADSGAGRIVVIASAHALVASPFKSAYISAKHGVLGLVKTLALEGAQAGICATAVCPAFVRTPLMERQIPDQAKAHDMSEERVLEEVILQPHAVKRLIEPDEVAATVAFLAGPDGSAFTGVPVTMDLGWSAR
jgi:3-hydroxybutyrate dehydrogenase